MTSVSASSAREMGDPENPRPLFERSGDLWIPQEPCVGPWSSQALHGGPVAALCVSAAEEVVSGEDLVTTRMTLDLVRPVPLAPLAVDARLLKRGRRVHLIDVVIRHEGKDVAIARVQRTSTTPVNLPDLTGTHAEPQPAPERPEDFLPFDPARSPREPAGFLRWATELRTTDPAGLYTRANKTAWLRVYAKLTSDRPLSVSAAVAAACDYTNALGAPAMPSQMSSILFPNADLTMHLVRNPVSKWVRMAPESAWCEHGIAHSRCLLWDEHGMLGISAVTLPLIEPGQY